MSMAGKKVWRDAATLILTAKVPTRKTTTIGPGLSVTGSDSSYFDYNLLMLKRSSKSKFMPNAFVFPGGVVSLADFAAGWKDHFKAYGYNKDDLEELVLKDVDRPILMKADVNESITRDIALRLTAIRETFEESGVLLKKSSGSGSSSVSEAISFFDDSSLNVWRNAVHSNPEKLLQLFQEIEAVPDVWSLKEWSDWLTPTDLNAQGKRRFDTIFYTACLEEIPITLLDQAEIQAVQWTDPASILQQFYARKLWLAPPQVYELSRLLNFANQDDLRQFCSIRHRKGLKSWLPVRQECSDGLISLLPGDWLYPEQPDYVGAAEKPGRFAGSLEESRTKGEGGGELPLNRLEFRDTYDCEVKVSGPTQHGHVRPYSFLEFQMNELQCEPVLAVSSWCNGCSANQRKFCHSQHCTQWQNSLTSPTLDKRRASKRLEERFMRKAKEYPTFPC